MRLALLTLLALLAACGDAPAPTSDTPSEPRAAPLRVVDDLGRSVLLDGTPTRVLSLAPNLTELVFAAEAGHLLPAVSTADTYPPEVDTLARFGVLPLDTEAIVALDPDLLLATTQVNTVESIEPLEALGIPTYFSAFERLDAIPAALRRLDALLGTDGGERVAWAFERRVAELDALTDSVEARPSVLVLVGDETLYAFGGDSYVQEMIRLAGGRSVTAGLGGQQAILSDEFVLQSNPDVIAVLGGEDYDLAALVDAHPTFSSLAAVQAGRVVGLNPDHVSRPGPRVVLGIEALAEALHPQLFFEVSARAELDAPARPGVPTPP